MSDVMTLFLILIFGYLIGSVSIGKLSLGSSGVLIVALIFGHFGFTISKPISSVGLAVFTASVGYIAGPVFLNNFKKHAWSFIAIGVFTIIVGAAICVFCIKVISIPTNLAVGMMTGALTSTPGLAAAVEATGDSIASVGYGIAYPFGVVGVVLFVQIISARATNQKVNIAADIEDKSENVTKFSPSTDLLRLSFAVILGTLLGNLVIPLPGGISFSFGTSGGPMIAGLVLGGIGRVGKFSLSPSGQSLNVLRELGMVLFLSYTGVQAGSGLVATLKEYGVALFIYGALMTLIPMLCAYLLARKVFKINIDTSLSSICGGMTSTPALGTLLNVAKDKTAAAVGYAATYPVALVCVVIASQLIAVICK